MTFELHKKRQPKMAKGHLKINSNYVVFPEEITDKIKEKFMEIYLDYETNRIGFLPSNDEIKGFIIRKRGRFASKHITFVHKDYSINCLYKYKKEKDMVVIEIPNLNKEKLFNGSS